MPIFNFSIRHTIRNKGFVDIKGFENLYMINTDGKIYSLITNKIIKPRKDRGGYLFVSLRKDGKCYQILVHRLVALQFLDNPNNYNYINHKDENKDNNNVNNLEWCSAKYNSNYNNMITKNNKLYKGFKIKVTDTVTGISYNFNTIREAAKELNLSYASLTRVLHTGQLYKHRYIVENE